MNETKKIRIAWLLILTAFLVLTGCGSSDEPIGTGYYATLNSTEKQEACYAYILFGNELLSDEFVKESPIPQEILEERFQELKENCE